MSQDNDLGKEKIFLSYLGGILGLCGGIYDDQLQLLEKYHTNEKADIEPLWRKVIEEGTKKKKEDKIFLYIISEAIYCWYFVYDKRIFVFGPIGTNALTPVHIYEFSHQFQIKKEYLYISKMTVEQIFQIIGFSYYEITQEELTKDDILKHTDKDFSIANSDKTEYDLFRLKGQQHRRTYASELEWYNQIKNGIEDGEQRGYEIFNEIGTLAKNNDYKQYEYMCVSGITLATRAAIEGGVPPMAAYEASDLLLQQLSKCTNLKQIFQYSAAFSSIFINLVHQYRQEKEQGTIVELCKEYVARHLYSSFTIQNMADDLALNRSHMSSNFSTKTGTTIQQYVRNERLNAAANLLKYSTESISQISDYMHFSSPSRFSLYFKEKFGMSPLRFRDENKLVEFQEKYDE